MKTAPSALEVWVLELIAERYKTKQAVAAAAGLTQGAFWRQVEEGSLGIEPLLRLALATGEPASEVLRRAEKGELATLIEQCYGPPQPVNPDLRAVIEILRELPDLAPVMRREVEGLQGVLQGRLRAHTEPDATPGADPHKRATLAVRGK